MIVVQMPFPCVFVAVSLDVRQNVQIWHVACDIL